MALLKYLIQQARNKIKVHCLQKFHGHLIWLLGKEWLTHLTKIEERSAEHQCHVPREVFLKEIIRSTDASW